ncbi:MAG: FecR domain-containing protein, partial [Candidatus Aminicenantes bacterium]|nr:FecR domain-containing protein [Candidatus Aminicenantes bacterium]
MKKIMSFLVFLVFCVSLSAASEDTEYYSYSYARLSYVNGDVFIQRAGDNGFEEGDVNLPVVKGDKIGTREGRAEIHFGKKNYLRIDRQTQLDLVELPERGSDIIQLHMLSGDIFLKINYLQREKDFEIHTPDASYYILQEGLYRFVVRE